MGMTEETTLESEVLDVAEARLKEVISKCRGSVDGALLMTLDFALQGIRNARWKADDERCQIPKQPTPCPPCVRLFRDCDESFVYGLCGIAIAAIIMAALLLFARLDAAREEASAIRHEVKRLADRLDPLGAIKPLRRGED